MARTDNAKSLAKAMGARLRERRTELGLSLSEAGRRSSVSASYLTAVESGTSTASLQVLSRLAHALDLTLGDFLATESTSTVQLGHLGVEPGTHVMSSPTLQLKVAFQNSAPDERGECPFPLDRSSVVVVVRAGTLTVAVDGEEWTLDEGDSLHAQEPDAITWRSGTNPTTAVWAVAPPEIS